MLLSLLFFLFLYPRKKRKKDIQTERQTKLKAFKKIPLFNNKISKLALSKYLQLRYIPAPFSIYEDIYKLEPGCLLTIDKSDYITIPNSYIKTNTSFHNISILKWWNKDSFKSNDLKSKFLREKKDST